ncbi:hypothetical protein Bca52824_089383 [Brassica carinata]|uniref:DUF8040 domain-containing protein n=1 Tax=Brassica carinata TaxID=52824 RepID=A0A8X7PEH1_BRACI|nr:hypothetical protein Bca52824_089383 [Brassica carinata]
MSSSRNTSGSQRRGRQSSGEARTTTDGGTTREGQYLWKDKNCEVMLELVIAELKADDYRSRMPDLIGEKISWDPEITSKIGYLRKLWNIHSQLVKRTGVAVDPSSGQIDMVETWWSDRIAQVQPTLDVDGITMVDQLQETQTAEPIVDLTSDQGCNRSIQSMSSRRLARRKTSFETQVESGFQRVVDTRQEFLEELRSRKIQKITYGDATSVLEKLPIEQLGVFWWAANKLLKNDADIREAFVKLENEEIKIKYMESLLGIDRHGSPCNQVDLLTTSQNHFQSVRTGGSTAIGANTGGGYMSFLGVHSTALEEPRREPTSFELRILELRSRGIQNLNEDELMELMLLEEEEFLQRYMHPILEYYKTNFFKQPMNKDWGNGWKLIRGQIYHNEVSCRTLIRMKSNNIKVDESVAIFLILCGQNDTQRDIGLRFGHAQETICRKFHYVLGAVVQLAVDYLRPRTTREFEAISNSLHGDKRYSPYFNGFVGALDGTHVPVMVTPGRDALRFVNRKGTASLNVLGIYIDFEEFDVGGDTTHSHSNVNNHSDDESDEQVNQNTSAGVYMKIVRDHIAEQIWTDKRHASRRL